MKELRRLLGFVRPYFGRSALAVLTGAMAALFTVSLPMLVRPLIDVDLGGAAGKIPTHLPDLGHVPGLDFLSGLHGLPVYALILAAFFGKGLFSYLSQYLTNWVGQRTVVDLRAAMGKALARQSVGYFSERPAGDLLSRITSDAEKVLVALTDRLYDVIKEPMTMIGLAAWLVWVEWPLAVLSLVLVPAVVLPVARYGRKLRSASERSQEKVAELSNRVHEVVRGIRVIHSSGTEEMEAQRIARAARGIFAANMRAVKVVALTPPLMELLAGLGLTAAFFYGRSRIAAGEMTQGQLLSFLTALFMLYMPAKKLSRVQAAFEQAIAASSRCFAVIDAPVEVAESREATDIGTLKGELRFEKVSFRYQERMVLSELDFTVPAGAVAALVGRSGAGKTTVANLLLRFYDPTVGRVLIDGRELRGVTLASLRRQIGLVAQDVVLFNDTLAANIAYGMPRATRAEIERAARAAYAEEFIARLPGGYEAMVGEGGVKLSTGQRQRIAIARAVLKDPPILLLDEATSALDAESESLVVQALSDLMRGRTTLVIAHRLATVRRADFILVLDEGRLLEVGTHEELMERSGGLYNRLAELQALGEIQE